MEAHDIDFPDGLSEYIPLLDEGFDEVGESGDRTVPLSWDLPFKYGATNWGEGVSL